MSDSAKVTFDEVKRLRKLKKLVKEGKIELASQDEISKPEISEKVDWILCVIAVLANEPGMRQALVTDLSSVGDFLPLSGTRIGSEDNDQIRLDLHEYLGVSLEGTLVDVAKRLLLLEKA